LVNAKFDLVIIDEAHYLKNNKSIRGEIMSDLIVNHNIERAWLLTGTPVANRPMDFFNLLKIIKSPIANNWQYFATRYCEARKMFRTLKNGKRKQIWLTDGASNLDELALKTKNLIIRRLKTEVLDMPDKVITPMYHELSDKGWKEYDMLWDEYLEKRKLEKKKGSIQRDLVELILLRKFIAMEAIPQTIEIVENAIEMGKKVIVFTNFTDELNELSDYFGKICVSHNGPMSDKEKQRSVDLFQNNKDIKVFVGNIKSAGVGITLTEATVVVFNSFDWVPGFNEQAEDRAYRIGQKNEVNVFYQLFENTISTRMWGVLKNKKSVISTIIGDAQFSEDEILEKLMDKLLEND
jgi:SWI/SNF-related matrix-associated actin-dependent regulator 1 of chromatin subfamily A